MKFTDIRMTCHQLSGAEYSRPGDLLEWMGAMQAQDYRMAKWAVGIRLKEGTLEAVDRALQTGEIVRTHVMRPTWHFVAGKDIRWMLKLSSQRVRKAVDSWTKGSGADIPESLYTKCNDWIGKMLSGRQCMTKEEIETELERQGIVTAEERVRRYLLRAETEGIVCSGGDKNGKPTYALLDEQVPQADDRCREEMLAELARRYFRSHSPASIQDFCWWSGLPVTEAREAVESIRGELIREVWEDREGWIYRSSGECRKSKVVHLLPAYDEYLIGYKNRSEVLDEKYYPKAFNRWGIFYPVVLYQGHIVGNWSKTEKGNRKSIRISCFEPDRELPWELLEKAESEYWRFKKESLL